VAIFTRNLPIETREPSVLVENRLAAGLHRFSLVVVGASGQRSLPDLVTLRVGLTIPPLRPVGPVGPIPIDPNPIRNPR
jgi:hypothetical protein